MKKKEENNTKVKENKIAEKMTDNKEKSKVNKDEVKFEKSKESPKIYGLMESSLLMEI